MNKNKTDDYENAGYPGAISPIVKRISEKELRRVRIKDFGFVRSERGFMVDGKINMRYLIEDVSSEILGSDGIKDLIARGLLNRDNVNNCISGFIIDTRKYYGEPMRTIRKLIGLKKYFYERRIYLRNLLCAAVNAKNIDIIGQLLEIGAKIDEKVLYELDREIDRGVEDFKAIKLFLFQNSQKAKSFQKNLKNMLVSSKFGLLKGRENNCDVRIKTVN